MPQFFIGVILVAFFWIASWSHLGPAGEFSFFPLWLGYILTIDGLVAFRGRASLLSRDPVEFVGLFVLSAPVWWLFEGLDQFTQNWHYIGGDNFTAGQVILISTISFATVIPAVFETAELISTFSFIEDLRVTRLRLAFLLDRQWSLMFIGSGMLLGIVIFPRYFFPTLWLWGVFMIDSLNWLRGRDSLFALVNGGNWQRVASLALGGLMCGLFWEMWNFFAMPKWYYTVPFFDFAKIFEMPFFGYLGYIPFAWELHALYQFVWGILGRKPVALTS